MLHNGISPFERFTAAGRDLPRLPVPPLEATVARYVASVAAVASPAEFRETALHALRFLQQGGATSGPALHRALLKRADEAGIDRSYLINWWNQLMYTAWREPLPINVSYWYCLGESTFSALDAAAAKAGLVSPPSFRAAALVLGAAAFRDRVWTRGEALEGAPGAKAPPLDGSMFRYIFHACRLPRVDDDGVRVYDGAGPTAPSDAIVVIRRGRLYAVSLADTAQAGAAARVSWPELTRRIDAAVAHADAVTASEGAGSASAGVGLGVLTAGHRNTWAAAAVALTGGEAPRRPSHGVGVRADPGAELPAPLCAADAHNLRVLTTIESSLLVLCMDDTRSASIDSRSLSLLVGNAHNRWFGESGRKSLVEAGGGRQA